MRCKFTAIFAVLFTGVAPAEKPNIIWLMAEDMGLDLECYGMPGVKTPHLNKMAREGILYKKAYCTNPICSPNRSAMMIGVHQNITNTHNHRSNRDVPLEAPFKPITSYLRDGGCTCLLGHDSVMKTGSKTDCNFKHRSTGPWDGVENFGLLSGMRSTSAPAASRRRSINTSRTTCPRSLGRRIKLTSKSIVPRFT
jgi:N-sulfoglucosamine sulfohydrolase